MRENIADRRILLGLNCLLAVVVLGALWTGVREAWSLAHAGHARGTVVSVRISHQGSPRPRGYDMYRPTISFMDADEKRWTFDSGSFGLEGGRVGGFLPVVYDPGYPGDAQIENFWGKWDPTFTFCYIGAFLLLFRWPFSVTVGKKKTLPPGPATPASL